MVLPSHLDLLQRSGCENKNTHVFVNPLYPQPDFPLCDDFLFPFIPLTVHWLDPTTLTTAASFGLNYL